MALIADTGTDPGNAYGKNINWASKYYAAGIIGGYSDGKFRPESGRTRAEAAVIIDRIAEVSLRMFPNE